MMVARTIRSSAKHAEEVLLGVGWTGVRVSVERVEVGWGGEERENLAEGILPVEAAELVRKNADGRRFARYNLWIETI